MRLFNLFRSRVLSEFLSHSSFTWILHPASWILLSCFLPLPLSADLSSPGYKITREWISGGGGGQVSSSIFKVTEGSVDFTAQGLMRGNQYKIESQIGLKDGIPPIPPEIDFVSPGNFSRFFTDETASYTVQARDPNGGVLQYQIKADQTVKVPWQANSSASYGLSAADKGRHLLKFEVGNSEAVTSLSQSQYVFRRTVK